MALLVSRLGHVQLGEAQRFTQEWEAEASLRIREGDTAGLDEYAAARPGARRHARAGQGPRRGACTWPSSPAAPTWT